jgi:O-antigen/teichoic acid export membrane protein
LPDFSQRRRTTPGQQAVDASTGNDKGRINLNTSSRIIWNACSKWLATLANAGMSLLLVPFLLSKLGKEGFGLSALVGVIVSLSAVADMGLQAALSRQLAAALAENNRRKFGELYASALSVFLTAGLLCAGACALFAPELARLFHVSKSLMEPAIWVVRYYGSATILLSLVKPAYTAVLASHNRFDLFNHAETGLSLARGASLLLVLTLTASGLYGWAAANLACSCGELIVIRHLARRVHPRLVLAPRFVRLGAMASLFSLGGYFFIVKLIGMLGVHADPLILTSFLGPAAVALYRPPGLLASLGRSIVLAMTWQLHPLATHYHVRGETHSLQQVLLRGTRLTLLIGIPVCVFLIVFAAPITTAWLGKQLQENCPTAAWLLVLFASSELCDYAGGSQSPVLIGMNRLRFVVLLNLPLAAVNLLGSILLVGYTPLGVIGVLVPTVTVFAIRRIVETIYVARATRVGVWRYLKESYLRPFAVLIGLSGVAVILRLTWAQPSISRLAECGVATAIVWAGLTWALGFTAEDRGSCRSLLKRIRTRFARPAVATTPMPSAQTGAPAAVGAEPDKA